MKNLFIYFHGIIIICDIFKNGNPYNGDSRYVLKKVIQKAKDKCYNKVYSGVEMEFFYFKDCSTPVAIDNGKYFNSIEDFYGFIQ